MLTMIIPGICSLTQKEINFNTYKYSLTLEQPNELLLRSIVYTDILPASSINQSSTLDFFAYSVKSFRTFLYGNKNTNKNMNYNTVLRMIFMLTKQQQFLEQHNHGFYCIHLDDIIVIDDSLFFCVNPAVMKEFLIEDENKDENKEKDLYIQFRSPFSRTGFCSPEILDLKVLPAKVFYTCYYYSLGAIAIYCLLGTNICGLEYTQVMDIISPLLHTKLYWFLLKCLCPDVKKRKLLFI